MELIEKAHTRTMIDPKGLSLHSTLVIEKRYRRHRLNLQKIRSSVDDHKENLDELRKRPWKKLQMKNDAESLNQANEVFHRRLIEVELTGSDFVVDAKDHCRKVTDRLKYWGNIHEGSRQRKQLQIQRENENIMKRLENTKPEYSQRSQIDWYKNQSKFRRGRRDVTAGHILHGMNGLLPRALPPIDSDASISSSSKSRFPTSQTSALTGSTGISRSDTGPTLLSSLLSPIQDGVLYSRTYHSSFTQARIGRAGWQQNYNTNRESVNRKTTIMRGGDWKNRGSLLSKHSSVEDYDDDSTVDDNSVIPRFAKQQISDIRYPLKTNKGGSHNQRKNSFGTAIMTDESLMLFSALDDQMIKLHSKSFSIPFNAKNCIVEICVAREYDENIYIRVLSYDIRPILFSERSIGVDKVYEVIQHVSNTSAAIIDQIVHFDDDIQGLRALFINLFQDIDVDGAGYLTFDQFQSLMNKINLNITSQELNIVFTEADINGNGVLDINEYIPLVADIIQTIRAIFQAKKVLQQQDNVYDKYIAERISHEQIILLTQQCREKIEEIDSKKYGLIRPIELKRCLSSIPSLSDMEISMICHLLPRDSLGRCLYSTLQDVLTHIKFLLEKNSFVEKNGSELLKFLLEICRKQEMNERELSPMVDDYRVNGLLSPSIVKELFQDNKKLFLNQFQLIIILSYANINDNCINIYEFVPLLAKIIEILFHPISIREKVEIIEKTHYSCDNILFHVLNMLERSTNEGNNSHGASGVNLLGGGSGGLVHHTHHHRQTIHGIPPLAPTVPSAITHSVESRLTPLQDPSSAITATSGGGEHSGDHLIDSDHPHGHTDESRLRGLLLSLFHGYDIDKNGILDENEILACLSGLKLKVKPIELKILMSPHKSLSYEDFYSFILNNIRSLVRRKHINFLQSLITAPPDRQSSPAILDGHSNPFFNDTYESRKTTNTPGAISREKTKLMLRASWNPTEECYYSLKEIFNEFDMESFDENIEPESQVIPPSGTQPLPSHIQAQQVTSTSSFTVATGTGAASNQLMDPSYATVDESLLVSNGSIATLGGGGGGGESHHPFKRLNSTSSVRSAGTGTAGVGGGGHGVPLHPKSDVLHQQDPRNSISYHLLSHLVILFKIADEGNTGYLPLETIESLLMSLNLHLSCYELNLLLQKVSKNHVGFVYYQEFIPIIAELFETLHEQEKAQEAYEERYIHAVNYANEMILQTQAEIQLFSRYVRDRMELIIDTIPLDTLNNRFYAFRDSLRGQGSSSTSAGGVNHCQFNPYEVYYLLLQLFTCSTSPPTDTVGEDSSAAVIDDNGIIIEMKWTMTEKELETAYIELERYHCIMRHSILSEEITEMILEMKRCEYIKSYMYSKLTSFYIHELREYFQHNSFFLPEKHVHVPTPHPSGSRRSSRKYSGSLLDADGSLNEFRTGTGSGATGGGNERRLSSAGGSPTLARRTGSLTFPSRRSSLNNNDNNSNSNNVPELQLPNPFRDHSNDSLSLTSLSASFHPNNNNSNSNDRKSAAFQYMSTLHEIHGHITGTDHQFYDHHDAHGYYCINASAGHLSHGGIGSTQHIHTLNAAHKKTSTYVSINACFKILNNLPANIAHMTCGQILAILCQLPSEAYFEHNPNHLGSKLFINYDVFTDYCIDKILKLFATEYLPSGLPPCDKITHRLAHNLQERVILRELCEEIAHLSKGQYHMEEVADAIHLMSPELKIRMMDPTMTSSSSMPVEYLLAGDILRVIDKIFQSIILSQPTVAPPLESLVDVGYNATPRLLQRMLRGNSTAVTGGGSVMSRNNSTSVHGGSIISPVAAAPAPVLLRRVSQSITAIVKKQHLLLEHVRRVVANINNNSSLGRQTINIQIFKQLATRLMDYISVKYTTDNQVIVILPGENHNSTKVNRIKKRRGSGDGDLSSTTSDGPNNQHEISIEEEMNNYLAVNDITPESREEGEEDGDGGDITPNGGTTSALNSSSYHHNDRYKLTQIMKLSAVLPMLSNSFVRKESSLYMKRNDTSPVAHIIASNFYHLIKTRQVILPKFAVLIRVMNVESSLLMSPSGSCSLNQPLSLAMDDEQNKIVLHIMSIDGLYNKSIELPSSIRLPAIATVDKDLGEEFSRNLIDKLFVEYPDDHGTEMGLYDIKLDHNSV